AMWWQQSLWKLPPHYTDDPAAPFGTTGLAFWIKQMAEFAPFEFQANLVKNVVLPNFYGFAPIIYLTEVAIGVSLMLGLFTRLGGLAGFGMADRKSTRLNSSHSQISYAVFCLKKKNKTTQGTPINKSLWLHMQSCSAVSAAR